MANRDRTLLLTSKERKFAPIADGCEAYFPAALAGVAENSFLGGAKHTGGELVHKRWLSTDHDNCISRHRMDIRDLLAQRKRGVKTVMMYVFDLDRKVDELKEVIIERAILMEANCLSWRSLALAQELHEQLGGAPLAPAALLEPPDTGIVV